MRFSPSRYILLFLATAILFGCARMKPLQNSVPFPVKDLPLAISGFTNIEYASLFSEALRMQKAGKLQSSAALFERCIEMDSLQPLAYFELSKMMASMGNLPLALALASDARYLAKDDEAFILHLGSLYSAAGMVDSTLGVLQSIRSIYPKSPALLYSLSGAYIETGNFTAADSAVRALLSVAPRNEQAIFRKYQLLLLQSKFDEAKKLLVSYSRKYPDYYKFHSALGEFYANFDQIPEAFASFSKMAFMRPDLPVSFLGMVRFYAQNDSLDSLIPLTVSLLSDDSISARDKMQFLFAAVNDSLIVGRNAPYLLKALDAASVALPNEGGLYVLYSDYYKNIGNFIKAESYLEKLTSFRKEDCGLWSQRIILLSQASDFGKLREVSTDALNYCTSSPVIYLFKAMAETELRLFTDAVSTVKSALPFVGTEKKIQSTFYALLGSAYNGLKEYSLSDDFFRLAISLSPDDYGTLNNYSYFLSLRNQDLMQAEKMILRCLDNEPDNVTYLDTYAWVLFNLNRFSQAASVMEKVFEKPVKSVEVFSHYVQILYSAGNRDRADKLFSEMQTLFSGDSSLATFVEQIENVKKNGPVR